MPHYHNYIPAYGCDSKISTEVLTYTIIIDEHAGVNKWV